MNALEICESDERLFGIALSGGDYTKDLQTHITGTGIELMGARQQMIIAARAAGVQCFDTVYTDLKDMDGFRKDVENIHLMGFDGKSIINPRQIPIVHEIFTPTQRTSSSLRRSSRRSTARRLWASASSPWTAR